MAAVIRNPRYVLYAAAQGRDPEAQLAADREQYLGGQMAGFMIWIQARWAEWRALRGYVRDRVLSDQDHADFDQWLARTHRLNVLAKKAVQAGGEKR